MRYSGERRRGGGTPPYGLSEKLHRKLSGREGSLWQKLIVSAGNNANEYLARHIGELGYTRPTIVASGGEARRRMDTNDFEVVIINTPLPDEFGHELGTDAVEKTDAGVILLAKTGTAEQIADKLQDFGVLVLAKPFTGAQFRQAVQIAASSYKRLAVLRTENAKAAGQNCPAAAGGPRKVLFD